jgi:hypothetical protein
VIVDDLHAVCVSILPNEAQPVAIVYPNAMLPSAVVLQRLQRVSWCTKIVEAPGRVKLEQFANRNLLDGLELCRRTRIIAACPTEVEKLLVVQTGDTAGTLVFELHLLQQGQISDIRSQAVKYRIGFETQNIRIAVENGAVEVFEGAVLIAERGADISDAHG